MPAILVSNSPASSACSSIRRPLNPVEEKRLTSRTVSPSKINVSPASPLMSCLCIQMLDSLDDKIVSMDSGTPVDEPLNTSAGGISAAAAVVTIAELSLISTVCRPWWWNVIEYMSLETSAGRFLIEHRYVRKSIDQGSRTDRILFERASFSSVSVAGVALSTNITLYT
ncbi:Srb2p [Saccharomyces cerevisiae AWRI796]|nr:Srb2p [Saccharomyces cerevisiae FostersB]EGA62039.1 Srb2p [Saccharomyces cerevisiae FostersO]EGA74750.1 Srb2p [Saccharomyces cerevisiae AWRI796]EGA78524.1 Srb2p [Saccharomyces cerevisiae Vin13]EGA86632.1 Srb2p [Saccharomyces cerevisiae VL3]